MSKKRKSASSASTAQRHIALASPHTSFQLVQKSLGLPQGQTAPAPQALAPTNNDPTGIKSYIAFSVAHALYPKGSGINPDQDISEDVKLNAASVAAEINVDAEHSATMHQLTWTTVDADDVSSFETVGNLVNLVKKNLN